MTEIIMQAYEVLDEFLKNPTYVQIKSYNAIINQKYKSEIQAFQTAKEAYDVIMNEGGSYHPDFKMASKRLSEAKAYLYAMPEVQAYFDLEKQFQDELNQFLGDLSASISPHIKAPNKIGIVTKGGSCHVH